MVSTTGGVEFMGYEISLFYRLIFAGLLGGLIGLEREFRAKDAGLRTHFFVAIGSALFMIISQFGFTEGLNQIVAAMPTDFANPPRYQADVTRVASQIVTGIGFLGAGAIIVNKRGFVSGLTTAAGIWLTSAIGVCVGAGFYLLASIATVITLAGFEILRIVSHKICRLKHELDFVLDSDDEKNVTGVLEEFRKQDIEVVKYRLFNYDEGYRVELTLAIPESPRTRDNMYKYLNDHPQIKLVSMQ